MAAKSEAPTKGRSKAKPRLQPRGQPVMMLAVVLGGWIAVRAALWETPFTRVVMELPERLLTTTGPIQPAVGLVAAAAVSAGAAVKQSPEAAADPVEPVPAEAPVDAPAIEPGLSVGAPAAIGLRDPFQPRLEPFRPAQPAQPIPQRLAAAHNMLFMAGLSGVTLPPELAKLLQPKGEAGSAPYQPLTTFVKSPEGGRWSADGWLLARDGGPSAVAPGQASYGRSQAGAVLRFGLAPSSPYRPMLYLRGSQALGGSKESEAALGLSARPIPGVPLRAAAEMRLTQVNGQTLVRPAAYAVTELPPASLPLGFTAEAYGQAGYVGGKYATAFADGQVRAERPVFDLGNAKLTAGGGAWGGAQKGAARLDIGPSASLQLKLGEASSRVSMDWRFRVAGDAEPASGPALTISAGF